METKIRPQSPLGYAWTHDPKEPLRSAMMIGNWREIMNVRDANYAPGMREALFHAGKRVTEFLIIGENAEPDEEWNTAEVLGVLTELQAGSDLRLRLAGG